MSEYEKRTVSREVEPVEEFTDVRKWLAAVILLADRGHIPNFQLGGDEDSQSFARDVRRLNRRHWSPGQVPRVPRRPPDYASPPRLAVIHLPQPRESRARPRGRRFRRVRRASSSSRGSPDDEPEPAGGGLQRLQRLRLIAPDLFRRDVDAWLGEA
jgi:hypothetical protein